MTGVKEGSGNGKGSDGNRKENGGGGPALPALFAPNEKTAEKVLEFLTAQIRTPNTRKAHAKAAGEFAPWCEEHEIKHPGEVGPVHVETYVETLQQTFAALRSS